MTDCTILYNPSGKYSLINYLTEIVVPDGTRGTISKSFYGYSKLKKVYIGTGITAIGYGAFNTCSALEEVYMSDTVTAIDEFAFYQCFNLKKVTLSNKLKSLSSTVFSKSKLFVLDFTTGLYWELADLGDVQLKNPDGFIDYNGNKYFIKNSKLVTSCKMNYGGKAYCFSSTGAMFTNSLVKISDGIINYFGSDGVMQTGWQKIKRNDGKIYYHYFGTDGAMRTGWQKITNSKGKTYTYYFGTNGCMVTGWQTIKNSKDVAYKYYFYTNGVMLTGWQTINNRNGVPFKYYFGANGVMRTGWQSIKNSKGVAYRYYFGDNGYMRTGWQSIKNSKGVAYKYYFHTNGVMLTGLQSIKNSKGVAYKYLFHTNGVMLTGWQTIKNSSGVAYKYYFRPSNGAMVTNYAAYKIGSGFYCFDKYGRWATYKTGFKKDAQYFYILKGRAVTGWRAVNGKKYYFSPKDAHMYLDGIYQIGNDRYMFNKGGSLAGNKWYRYDVDTYYFKNGKMVKGWLKLNDRLYYFRDDGYGWAYMECMGWTQINGKWYYFNDNGTLNSSETAKGFTGY